MIYTVTEDWTATYSDPINLTAKERVELTGRQDDWDGHIWLWAKSVAGLEGWIPDSLVEEVNGLHRAREDYTAMELSCQAGEVIQGIKETHGWVLCQSPKGRIGWVPQKNLTQQNG
jgi:hypothetical protein